MRPDRSSSTLILTSLREGPWKDRRMRVRAKTPTLTVVYHADCRRVGERAVLSQLSQGETVALSRKEPDFAGPEVGRHRPLDDRYVSRKPILLVADGGGYRLDVTRTSTFVVADGEPVAETRTFSAEDLDRGIILELGEHVALLFHYTQTQLLGAVDRLGLIGDSDAMARLRQEIGLVADLDLPVLIRGETGTGKELTARAIHDAGRLRDQPFVSLNMGAVPPSLAASELFGSSKGAYTGSVRSQIGYFHRAHGGTLFLDEIGETPPEVQVMLLRVLETGEIQKVGVQEPQKVDVRLLAATDADLEEAIRDGRFREPLLHRLSVYEIHIPPLRERRDDVSRMLYQFLREELRQVGEEHRLDESDTGKPWLPMSIVSRLVRHDWPGNVRQLRNVARQLVVASRGADRVRVGPQVERLLREVGHPRHGEPDAVSEREQTAASEPAAPPKRKTSASYRKPSDVSEEELVDALRAHQWQLKPAAAHLGISRPSLYNLVERSPRIRKVSDLSRAEILEARDLLAGDLDRMVEHLEVSKGGLVQRMKAFGLA